MDLNEQYKYDSARWRRSLTRVKWQCDLVMKSPRAKTKMDKCAKIERTAKDRAQVANYAVYINITGGRGNQCDAYLSL